MGDMSRAAASASDAPFVGGPVAVDLMNTLWADRDGTHDALASDAEVRGWLAAVEGRAEVADAGVAAWLSACPAPELSRVGTDLRALRDAARRLAAEETQDPRPDARDALVFADGLDVVNRLAARAPVWPVLTWRPGETPSSSARTEGRAGDAVVAWFAAAVVALFGSDVRTDLRACLAPGCVLYFVKEHPRRQWCSSACGNRARVARHYRRHQARSSPSTSATTG
jgi:predicted RNA-binding Zn ribbon-like protein